MKQTELNIKAKDIIEKHNDDIERSGEKTKNNMNGKGHRKKEIKEERTRIASDMYKGGNLKEGIELSKEWRKDKNRRRLGDMGNVVDRNHSFLRSGTGDVVEPEDGQIAAIGSGGN